MWWAICPLHLALETLLTDCEEVKNYFKNSISMISLSAHKMRFRFTSEVHLQNYLRKKALCTYKITLTIYCLRNILCHCEVIHLKKVGTRELKFSILCGMLKHSWNFCMSKMKLPWPTAMKRKWCFPVRLIIELMLQLWKLISHEVFKLEMRLIYQIKGFKILFSNICDTYRIKILLRYVNLQNIKYRNLERL